MAFDASNNVLAGKDVVKAKKVACNVCGWERSPNQTRVKHHIDQCPKDQGFMDHLEIPVGVEEVVERPPKVRNFGNFETMKVMTFFCSFFFANSTLAIERAGYVAVAVDGWEDHQKFPTLAFTVHMPGIIKLFNNEFTFDWISLDFLLIAVCVRLGFHLCQ